MVGNNSQGLLQACISSIILISFAFSAIVWEPSEVSSGITIRAIKLVNSLDARFSN